MNKIIINSRQIIVFFIFVFSFSVVVFFDQQMFNDGDVFMHVAAGQWILSHHAVPHIDPFSYSFAGVPWVAHEWLSELLVGLAYTWGGWGGVLVLIGLAYSLAMGSLTMFLVHRGGAFLPICLTLLLSMVTTFPSLLARPHILALPCFVLWLICLLRAREKGNAPPAWPTALILLFWVNLHGSFAIGLFLIVPFAVEAVLAEQHSRLHVLGAWARFMALSCAIITITPNGWHGLLFPFQLLMMPQLAMIQEWKPMVIRLTEPFVLSCLTFVYVVLTRRLKIPPIRWLLLLGFAYISVRHIRYELLAAVVTPLILAEPLGLMAERNQGRRVIWHASAAQWSALAVTIGALTGLRMAYPYTLTDRPVTPLSVLAHVPAELRKLPVLNSYGLGGILIFEGIKPIIDGRADMYGDAFMKEHDAVMDGNKTLLQAWSTEFGLRWAYLKPTAALVNVLDSDPQWKRLYSAPDAIVYVKEKISAPSF